MLSYQHAYHAGNPADLHKHIFLCELITHLTQKQRGVTYMETHSGRGLYALKSDEALKTGEARDGIEKLAIDPATPYGHALIECRQIFGEGAYAGSPLLATSLFREQDRAILMELHPQEYPALKLAMRGTAAELHHRDGYEGVLAISPPTPRKGLVLIDPSYEVKSEYERAANFIRTLMKKWPEATILLWYPLLAAERHYVMLDQLASVDMIKNEVRFSLKDGKGMTGSGLALINPPYGSGTLFERTIEQTNGILKAET